MSGSQATLTTLSEVVASILEDPSLAEFELKPVGADPEATPGRHVLQLGDGRIVMCDEALYGARERQGELVAWASEPDAIVALFGSESSLTEFAERAPSSPFSFIAAPLAPARL